MRLQLKIQAIDCSTSHLVEFCKMLRGNKKQKNKMGRGAKQSLEAGFQTQF